MEYTKDMILEVNYGQAKKKLKKGILEKMLSSVAKHKIITAIISISLMLIVLDIMLVSSFIQVLSLLGQV